MMSQVVLRRTTKLVRLACTSNVTRLSTSSVSSAVSGSLDNEPVVPINLKFVGVAPVTRDHVSEASIEHFERCFERFKLSYESPYLERYVAVRQAHEEEFRSKRTELNRRTAERRRLRREDHREKNAVQPDDGELNFESIMQAFQDKPPMTPREMEQLPALWKLEEEPEHKAGEHGDNETLKEYETLRAELLEAGFAETDIDLNTKSLKTTKADSLETRSWRSLRDEADMWFSWRSSPLADAVTDKNEKRDYRHRRRRAVLCVRLAALRLPAPVHQRLLDLCGPRYNSDTGILRIVSDDHADVTGNKHRARRLLSHLLTEAYKADGNYVAPPTEGVDAEGVPAHSAVEANDFAYLRVAERDSQLAEYVARRRTVLGHDGANEKLMSKKDVFALFRFNPNSPPISKLDYNDRSYAKAILSRTMK